MDWLSIAMFILAIITAILTAAGAIHGVKFLIENFYGKKSILPSYASNQDRDHFQTVYNARTIINQTYFAVPPGFDLHETRNFRQGQSRIVDAEPT
ncbi:hypothetical protein EDC01DRAFT_658416 [Geopyxis carbonaria]|nr:hypothetical protein EDC01DRAFT_658416 [Geopyxis carbonaria]